MVQSITVNVSPITTLIAARLSPSGDPAQLTTSDASADKITAATADIKTALAPLLEAAEVAADANPLTMAFKADSTGLDKALDLLGKPTIVRASDGKPEWKSKSKPAGRTMKPMRTTVRPKFLWRQALRPSPKASRWPR